MVLIFPTRNDFQVSITDLKFLLPAMLDPI